MSPSAFVNLVLNALTVSLAVFWAGPSVSACAKCGLNDQGAIHAWMVGETLFLRSIQTAIRECAVNNKSYKYALRLCNVAFRGARRAPFPQTISQPTRCMSHALQATCQATGTTLPRNRPTKQRLPCDDMQAVADIRFQP